MLRPDPSLADLIGHNATAVVIGAGPIGLNLALALADRGVRVLVLESGGEALLADRQALAADHVMTPETHHQADITVSRRLGGAGNLWGGRCVPCDRIDFDARPWLGLPEGWPITEADLSPYLAPAVKALGAGDPVPGLQTTSDAFATNRLERWSDEPRPQALHRDRIATDPAIMVALGVTVTGMELDDKVEALTIHLHRSGETARLSVPQIFLAAGGNASTRLLLNVQSDAPDLFGGADGPLGRYYMGHVNGQIADIVFDNTALHDAMTYYVDAHGSYVRRRITPSDHTQQEAGIGNVAFWPVVPEIAQAEHRSGPLSAVFLGLTAPVIGKRIIAEPIRLKHVGKPPYRRGRHILNVLTDPISTVGFVPWFLWNRKYARHRVPGFFLTNPGRRYGLEFHSEHLPSADSRVSLSDDRDATGMRRLTIDFRFSEADVQSVLKAHDVLEDWLMREGLARLVYRYGEDEREVGVLKEAQHGNHQEGTIRMGRDRASAVVDGWGQCFDLPNLHVVSTAVLPTSSQANPTLTALQIGLRAVDRLAKEVA